MFCRGCVRLFVCHYLVVVALAGFFLFGSCGGDKDEGTPQLPRMPQGVKSDLNDPHSPDTTYLKDEGGMILIDVKVHLLTQPEHHISSVRVVAPVPGFKKLASYTYSEEDMKKGKGLPWSHLFKIPRAKLPKGLAAVLVISHCDQHGEYGALQAVFNFGR